MSQPYDIVLASASPRRVDLLTRLGCRFLVDPAQIDEEAIEHSFSDQPPKVVAGELARRKAETVALRHSRAVVIAADTVVELDGRSLGKPHSSVDAMEMLGALSGRDHTVTTALSINAPVAAYSALVSTRVALRAASQEELHAYVRSEEPMDKAGAYAIQGKGASLVHSLDGCYLTVVGLPVCVLATVLEQLGLLHPGDAIDLCDSMARTIAGTNPPYVIPPHPLVSNLQMVPCP